MKPGSTFAMLDTNVYMEPVPLKYVKLPTKNNVCGYTDIFTVSRGNVLPCEYNLNVTAGWRSGDCRAVAGDLSDSIAMRHDRNWQMSFADDRRSTGSSSQVSFNAELAGQPSLQWRQADPSPVGLQWTSVHRRRDVEWRVTVPKSVSATDDFGYFRSSEQHADGCVRPTGKEWLPIGVL